MTKPRRLQTGDVVGTASDVGPDDPEPLIVRDRLEDFLDERGLGGGALEVERVGDGHSMETFLLRRGDTDLVLRRPPRPPITPGAHDVLREGRVLRGLLDTEVRAPRLLATCDDPAVIGSPFTITELVDGIVLGEELPPALRDPADRRRIVEELVDALVELHACDPERCGLGDLGVPGDYLPRQIERFRRVWGRDAVREVPDVESVADWLERELPPAQARRLIHGDFRLGNVMYDRRSPASLLAILDWETTTVGDPLTDLGYLIGTYPRPGESDGVLSSLSSVASQPGFPEAAELAERYAERSGRSIEHLRWYVVFALWKVAIILEGSYRRFVRGTADDTFFSDFGPGVPELAGRAAQLTEQGGWMSTTRSGTTRTGDRP